jgi:hypothetical protein
MLLLPMLYHKFCIESWIYDCQVQALSCPLTQYKMQNKRDHGEHEKNMNQSTCNVEYGEASDPSDQQNHE